MILCGVIDSHSAGYQGEVWCGIQVLYLRRYLVEENAVPSETVPEDSEIFAGINEARLKISEQKAQEQSVLSEMFWETENRPLSPPVPYQYSPSIPYASLSAWGI